MFGQVDSPVDAEMGRMTDSRLDRRENIGHCWYLSRYMMQMARLIVVERFCLSSIFESHVDHLSYDTL